ncbi:YbhB/YbcL family Raf kinase inhibitor-like protein [Candidatus Thorarchaeota archaeon]|nr:MAG: YbhB/YbcL family Raf kinase inhibitor-like protein [Candidatus Thorarchaeota archaeon]
MELRSDDFDHGGQIPDKCAYRNDNIHPHLEWSNVPEGTESFALIFNDPDAPAGNWLHWLVHSIPPEVRSIPEGESSRGVEVENDFGVTEYGGPAPPSGTHRYIFTLYALDVPRLEGVTKETFKDKCEEHMIESDRLMGTYSK